MKYEVARILVLNDVFVAVAVVFALLSRPRLGSRRFALSKGSLETSASHFFKTPLFQLKGLC